MTLKRSFAILAVAAGTLVVAAPAGASAYQHNQTDLEFNAIQDGTSNTVMFGYIAMPDMGGQYY